MIWWSSSLLNNVSYSLRNLTLNPRLFRVKPRPTFLILFWKRTMLKNFLFPLLLLFSLSLIPFSLIYVSTYLPNPSHDFIFMSLAFYLSNNCLLSNCLLATCLIVLLVYSPASLHLYLSNSCLLSNCLIGLLSTYLIPIYCLTVWLSTYLVCMSTRPIIILNPWL